MNRSVCVYIRVCVHLYIYTYVGKASKKLRPSCNLKRNQELQIMLGLRHLPITQVLILPVYHNHYKKRRVVKLHQVG